MRLEMGDRVGEAFASFPFGALHDLNERCIELLVNAARADTRPPFPLVHQLRPLLRSSRPDVRRRAAQRGFLLLDMEFANAQWWQAVRAQPARPLRTPAWRGSFPRRSAVPLTRSVLTLAWHGLRADQGTACIVLGISRPVAEIIASFELTDLDPLADRRFRHLQPRWHDRTAVWRHLLQAAGKDTPHALRQFDLRGLQLLAGELMPQPG